MLCTTKSNALQKSKYIISVQLPLSIKVIISSKNEIHFFFAVSEHKKILAFSWSYGNLHQLMICLPVLSQCIYSFIYIGFFFCLVVRAGDLDTGADAQLVEILIAP